MGPAVAPDGDRARALVRSEAAEAAAERPGVFLGECFSDDSANVIFAKDGGIECVGHHEGEQTKGGKGSRRTVTPNSFQGPFRNHRRSSTHGTLKTVQHDGPATKP